MGEHVLEPANKAQFEKIIKEAGSGRVVVVDFFASWCGPCKMMMPKFHRLADEHHDKITFIKVDVEEQEAIVEMYDIQMMPTFVFIRDGKQFHMIEGNQPDELVKEVGEVAKQ